MKKVFSLLLSMMLLCSFTLATISARAATTSGMEFNKTAVANDDGTFTITLEAYATGSKVISTVTKDVPTDIILVLDQSGSMGEAIGTVSFSQLYNANNSDLYNLRHNGGSSNLWHKLEDGTYVSVSVNVQETAIYTKIENGKNNPGFGYTTNTNFYSNQNNLYAKVNGEYVKVTVSLSGHEWTGTYTYTIPDNMVIATSENFYGSPTITGTDDKTLYLLSVDNTKSVYTYTYTDSQGVTQTIGTSTGANNTFSTTLYQRNTSSNGGGSRLNALKTAVTTFASNVATKAAGADGNIATTEDNVNHRIAMVGFAGTNSSYGNSEILIGRTQYNYNVSASQHYDDAFQDMSTTQGKTNITNSIDVLDADGGTHPDHGLTMANEIFHANPIEAGSRHRVVIVFTDGVPGDRGFDSSVASSAITQARITKETYGATVFTVGVFSGADATSAGNQNGTETQKANWFMQQMSSNNGTVQNPSYYLSAGDAATLNNIFKQISQNIQSGSSSATLDETAVVKDIIAPQFTLPPKASADDITIETYACTGKSGDNFTWSKNPTTMGAKATVADGQVNVTGFDFADNYVAEIKTNGAVTGYRGHKLVIKFKVVPEEKFLGGNDVYTNTSAGIYKDAKPETEPTIVFPRPQVNVPIEGVNVDVKVDDLNVYLLGDVTYAQINDSTTVKCGDVDLNLNAPNYGLDPAMLEYVEITVTYEDKNGNVLTNLTDLREDTAYEVAVTVAPKKEKPDSTEGEVAKAKSGSDSDVIRVFMPYLEYQDSAEKYHSVHTFPKYFAEENLVGGVIWKHGDTLDTAQEMDSAKPVVELNYKYSSDDIDSTGKIIEKEYIPVQVTIELDGVSSINQTVIENGVEKKVNKSLTDFVTFTHSCDCKPEELEASPNGACQWTVPTVNGNPAFLIHVCDVDGVIKITKKFVDQNNAQIETDESALFTVKDSEGNVLWTVVVTGNNSEYILNVPVGTYTVTENTDWTIRYSPTTDQAQTAKIVGGETVDKPAAVEFTNTLVDKWLIDEFGQNNVFNAEKLEVSNDEAQ